MLANTLSITIGSDDARVLVRVNQDNFGSTYRLASESEFTELVIRNSTEKQSGFIYDRHNAELRHTIYAVGGEDPSPEKHYVASTTFRTRRVGGDPTRLANTTKALGTIISSTLAAAMVQGES